MPTSADILNCRKTKFVLWCPRPQTQPPRLVIGRLCPGSPPVVDGIKHVVLPAAANTTGLFEADSATCGLSDGVMYHYRLEVDDRRSNQ